MTQLQYELVAELNGNKCCCGHAKISGHTFCQGCYYTLPPDMRLNLYRRIGKGYEEAYRAACLRLKEILDDSNSG